METRETDRVTTRPWAWVHAQEVSTNSGVYSASRTAARFLASKAVDLVDEYSNQIEWWIDCSKTVIFLSFLYSIATFNFFEGYLMMLTGMTLTSGFAVTFCMCKKTMTTNFTALLKSY
jgi:hypothetical protein